MLDGDRDLDLCGTLKRRVLERSARREKDEVYLGINERNGKRIGYVCRR